MTCNVEYVLHARCRSSGSMSNALTDSANIAILPNFAACSSSPRKEKALRDPPTSLSDQDPPIQKTTLSYLSPSSIY